MEVVGVHVDVMLGRIITATIAGGRGVISTMLNAQVTWMKLPSAYFLNLIRPPARSLFRMTSWLS